MKTTRRTSVLSNTAVWLGASISVAEIMAGAYIAPIGLQKGLLAIIIGHIIGGILFYLCGRIGAESGRCSMNCVALSFGPQGAGIFAGMNVLQLTVWTALMLHVSARTLTTITSNMLPTWFWCVIIGAAVTAWVFAEDAEIGHINLVASSLLLILTFAMCYHVIQYQGVVETTPQFEPLSFGSAIELSLAMPLAWIPLVADYTRKAEHPHLNNIVSTLAYTLGSGWMYGIGLAAAVYCGHSDIIKMLMETGIIRLPLLIVVLATMTSTFLDACSAGISAQTISHRYSVRFLAIVVLIVATLLSLLLSLDPFDQFLYLIASVFTPMIAIMVTDYFVLGKRQTERSIDLGTMLLWAVGFVLYRLLMSTEIVIGYTLPLLVLLGLIRYVTQRIR